MAALNYHRYPQTVYIYYALYTNILKIQTPFPVLSGWPCVRDRPHQLTSQTFVLIEIAIFSLSGP